MPPILPKTATYTETSMETAIKGFKAKKIPIYEPGEDNYERYVATANLIYRFSNPSCVVQPKCACDVRDIIKIAKPLNIPITIKNGGHSYAGASTTNVGILMELGLMNEVNVDVESKIVTVKGGALWFHVYKKLVSMHLDRFVVNGGRCPTVGVSGFILGGGLSPFTRSFGMGCDTVEEFTIVTAEGDEVTVSKNLDPKGDKSKLFWALCGAGGGNFGVVVEMKLALKELRSNFVVAGRYTWYPERQAMDAFMTTMNSFYTQNWPDDMTIDSSWLCELNKKDSDLGVRFLTYYNGGRTDFDKTIDGWTLQSDPPEHGKLKEQLKRRSLPEKSSRFLHETLAAQWVEETKKAFPTNRTYQIYTSFVFRNDENSISGITQIVREKMEEFRKQFAGETGTLQVTFIHSGGKANMKKPEETAFRWRGCIYHAYIMIQWDEKWLELNMRDFLDQMKPKLSPYGMVKGATFINFPDDSLKPEVHEKSYYGMNYLKLREIKTMWDKDNFFRWPQGIQLSQRNTTKPAKIDHQKDDDLMKSIANGALTEKESVMTDVLANQQWESYLPTSTNVYGSEVLPELVNVVN